MKYLILCLSLLLISGFNTPVGAQTPTAAVVPVKKNIRTSRIRFDQKKIDMGTMKEDAVVKKEFTFTNTGNADLVILNAKGSCGCTIPEYSKTPIAPGAKGTILVTYTARNKVGPQKPIVTVNTNGIPSTVRLELNAWVEQIPGGVK